MDNKVIGINLSESDRKRYEDVAGMPLTKWFRMLAEKEYLSKRKMSYHGDPWARIPAEVEDLENS